MNKLELINLAFTMIKDEPGTFTGLSISNESKDGDGRFEILVTLSQGSEVFKEISVEGSFNGDSQIDLAQKSVEYQVNEDGSRTELTV